MTSSIITVTLLLASILVQGKLVVGETNESEVNGSDSQQTPSSNAGASPPSARCFRLPAVPAQCKSGVTTTSRSWFYDARSSSCRQLSFEECSAPDGSDSGFETLEECIATCLRQPSSGAADAVVNTTTNVADDVTTSPIPNEEETSTTAGQSLPSGDPIETQQPRREAAETADETDGKMSPDGNAKQLETGDSTDSDTKDNSADDASSVNGNDGDARADDVPSTPSEGLAVLPNNELSPSVGGDADTNETSSSSSSGIQQRNEPKAKRSDNADEDVPPTPNNDDERSGNSKNEEKTDSNAVVSTKLADNVGNDLSADMANQSAVTSDGRLPQSSSYSEDARYRSTPPVVERDQSSERNDSAEKTLLPPPAGNDRRTGLLNFIRIIVRQNGKVRPRDDGRRKNRFGKSDFADESDDRNEDSDDVKRNDINGKQFAARKSSNQRYAAQKLSQALSQLPTRNKKPVAKATNSAKSVVPSSRPYMCQLPAVRGYCYGRMPRWYFNAAANRCQLFIYTGCGGNINNFKHLMACVSTCSVDVEPPTVNSSCLDGSCMMSDDDDDDTMPKQSSNKRPMTQLPMMRSYSAQQLPDFVGYPVQRSSRGRASGQPQDRTETGTLRTITIMMPVRFNEGIAMPSFSPDSDVSDSSSVPLNLEMSRQRTGSSVPKQFSLNDVMADAAQSRQERRMPSNRRSSQDATSAILAGSLPLPVSHKFFIPALMAQTQPLMSRDSPMPLLQQQSDSQQPPANVQSGQKQQKKQQQQRQQQLVQLPWSQQHQQAQLVTLPWQRQSVPQRSVAAPANRLPDSAVLKNDLVMTSISYGLIGGRSTPEVNQRVQEDAGQFSQRYPFIGFTANRLMPLQNSGMPMAAAAAGRNIPLNRGFQMFVEEEENLPPVAMKQQMAFDGNRRADASPNKPRRRLPPNADRRPVNDDNDDDESGRRDYEFRRPRPTEPSRQRSSGSSTRRSSSSSRSRLSTKRGSSSKRYQNKSTRYRDSKRGSWRYDADRYSPPTRYDNRLPMPLHEERYELTPATSGKLTMFQIVVRRQQDIAHQGFIQPPAPQQQQQQQLPPRGWSPIDTLADALMQTHGELTQPPAAGVRERTPVPLQKSASAQQPPQPISDAREMETARGERRNNVDDDDDNDDDSPPQIVVVADDAADDKNQPSYVCFLPVDIGNCKSYQNKWFFNAQSGRCQMFFYGGCGGNGNRFDKLESCQRICVPSDTSSAKQSSPAGNQTPADDVVPPTLAPPPVSPPSPTPAEAAVVVNDDVVSTTPEPEPEQTTEPYEGDVIIVTSPVYVPMTIEQLEEYERSTQTSNESHVDSQGQGHVPDHGDSEHGAAHNDHHIVSDVYSAAVPGFSTQYIAIVSVLGAVGLVVIILVIITIVRLCRRYYKSKKEMVVEDVMKAHMYGDLPQVVYTQTAGVIGKLDEKL